MTIDVWYWYLSLAHMFLHLLMYASKSSSSQLDACEQYIWEMVVVISWVVATRQSCSLRPANLLPLYEFGLGPSQSSSMLKQGCQLFAKVGSRVYISV